MKRFNAEFRVDCLILHEFRSLCHPERSPLGRRELLERLIVGLTEPLFSRALVLIWITPSLRIGLSNSSTSTSIFKRANSISGPIISVNRSRLMPPNFCANCSTSLRLSRHRCRPLSGLRELSTTARNHKIASVNPFLIAASGCFELHHCNQNKDLVLGGLLTHL